MSISRAKLRGKPLDKDCKKARISHHEYGINDNRCFCQGLGDGYDDGGIDKKCYSCNAFVGNITA